MLVHTLLFEGEVEGKSSGGPPAGWRPGRRGRSQASELPVAGVVSEYRYTQGIFVDPFYRGDYRSILGDSRSILGDSRSILGDYSVVDYRGICRGL